MRLEPLLDVIDLRQESWLLHLPYVALKEIISYLPAQYALETLPQVCQQFLWLSEEKMYWKPSQKVQIFCTNLVDRALDKPLGTTTARVGIYLPRI